MTLSLQVVILMKKACSEKTPASTRFRARRKEAAEQHEQLFQLVSTCRAVTSSALVVMYHSCLLGVFTHFSLIWQVLAYQFVFKSLF